MGVPGGKVVHSSSTMRGVSKTRIDTSSMSFTGIAFVVDLRGATGRLN